MGARRSRPGSSSRADHSSVGRFAATRVTEKHLDRERAPALCRPRAAELELFAGSLEASSSRAVPTVIFAAQHLASPDQGHSLYSPEGLTRPDARRCHPAKALVRPGGASSNPNPSSRSGRCGRVGQVTTPLEDLLARHVENGTIQGAVALLGRGDDVELAAVGVASDDGRAMPADAIMRIQSMTKVITSVALRLVESGRLRLDQS